MPELPEMETYKSLLSETILNKRIQNVQIERARSINVSPDRIAACVVGQSVIKITRQAKHLTFHLSNDWLLLLHLMVGGSMYYGTSMNEQERAAHVIIRFEDGHSLSLIGLLWGYLHLVSLQEWKARLSKLGPEPIDAVFDKQLLKDQCKGRRAPLKGVLINQEVISGIGNVYSDESAFEAGLRPDRKITTLTETDWQRLSESIPAILREAISVGGYNEEPYQEGDTLTGGYTVRLRVHYRKNRPCHRCGTRIQLIEVSSRKTYFCPVCQK